MQICDYGCGQEGKYYFPTVNKWCCSKNCIQCLQVRKKVKFKATGRKDSEETKKKKSNSMKGTKNPNYGKSWKDSEETKKKKSEANKGHIPWNKGKQGYLTKEHIKKIRSKNKGSIPWNKDKSGCFSKQTINKMKINSKLTIKIIKDRYPTFYKEEELRYNPDKPGEKEIQVHCKNHLCENSKEKGGWFTPSFEQIQTRKNQLEKQDGNDGSFFYCSQYCKDTCPIYNLSSDPFKNTEKPYTQAEYNTWNSKILRRQKKEDGYNFCEICYSIENLHVHHEKPVKTHPHLALDPDNGIVLCKDCHIKYGHKTGTECSTGALANKVLPSCKLGGQGE